MKKIIIDAGHGGVDSGTVNNNLVEKDYTLLISNYIYDRLKELGFDVSLTRNSDITLSPTDRVNKIKTLYNLDNNVIIISNHINAGGGDSQSVTNV